MKLFRHYKDKPYKYIGIAKHSETLEEMVVYETCYENAEGRVWVRPKKMFFDSVEVNGKFTRRFKEIPLNIKVTTDVTGADIEIIAPLIERAFGEWDVNWFHSTFNNHAKFHLAIGYIEDQAIGFKLGYERDKWEFYSWLGAVLPEYRGLGVASDLMRTQHEWCRKQGYRKVLTKTQNRFRDMLFLNLKNGFDVIGTHVSDQGGVKIVLEKKL